MKAVRVQTSIKQGCNTLLHLLSCLLKILSIMLKITYSYGPEQALTCLTKLKYYNIKEFIFTDNIFLEACTLVEALDIITGFGL